MNKVYVLAPGEDWIVDRFVKEWYEDNSDISTKNIQEANVVWLLADWAWKNIGLHNLQSKKIITTVHHIVPEKFNQNEINDFLLRDKYTTIYHVYNKQTEEFIKKFTNKPIKFIPYWANQKIWKPSEDKFAKQIFREKYGIPINSYVIGSFQRDTEGAGISNGIHLPKLEKGPDLFVEYVKYAAKRNHNLHVLLAGWRRQYVIQELISAHISYTYIERPEQEVVNELYQTIDLYPVASRCEGGPQSIIECGLLKIPVISRNIGIASQVLSLDSINDDLTKTTPNIPNIENMKLPFGYTKYRTMIQSIKLMAIFYIYKDNQFDYTCDAAARGVISEYKNAGCITLSESELLSLNDVISEKDTIIIHISLSFEESHKKLQSINCKKILYSMDESKSDQILFRTQLEFCNRHKITTIINACPSKRNIDFLSKAGINTITMVMSGSPRKVSYENKKIDILISGQINESYYPIRCKIFNALRDSNLKYVYLPHCGMEESKAIHQFHGKKFFDLLDICWIGVTCRAGSFRDRLLTKYVEFGFSKVLPVGDCPTYMHHDMSSNMIEITELDSNKIIIDKINEALIDKQKLIDRIEKYSSYVHFHHDMNKNVHRTIDMINNNNFDSIAY